MRITAAFLAFLFCVPALPANSCRLPYQLGISGKSWSHFYAKTDASNIWIEGFSSEKFIKTFKGKVNFYDYVKALTHHKEYSNVLDQNIKALTYKLFDKNLITQVQYKGLLQSLSKHNDRKQIIKTALKELKGPTEIRSKIELKLQNSKLNKTELELIGKKLLSLKEDVLTSDRLFDYIDFLNSRKSTELSSYIDKIDDLLSSRSKQIRNFNRSLEKVENYKNKISANLEKRFLKENNGESLNSSQRKRLEREIASKTNAYSKTLRSCGNREFLSTHAKTSEKKFTRFLLGFSTLTTAAGFTFANYQDPIDQEWVKKLGYEVVFGAFFAWLGAKVSINPHFSFMKKTAVNMGVSAGFDIFDSFLYDTLISDSENKSKNLSEEKKKAIIELTKEFEQRELDKKFLNSYKQYFYVDQEEKNPQLIYESELAKEELSDDIIQSISHNIEQGNMVDWLSQNAGVQRFTFHRAWDVISIPKTVVLGMAMYQVFCMSKINPGKAYRIAASMIIADEVFESFLYYKVRKSTINQ